MGCGGEYWAQRAMFELARHNPQTALGYFQHALENCPANNERTLARLLYFLGFALMRLGDRESAVASWLAAHRLRRDTFASKVLRRYANCYGMAREDSSDLDDWKAFLAVQVERYLATKRNGRFCSEAERDMVRDLLFDYWCAIRVSGVLEGRSPQEKERLFREVEIVFPYRLPGEGLRDIIPVNFRTKSRVGPGDRCPCGSGLSFMACCGRLGAPMIGRFRPISRNV